MLQRIVILFVLVQTACSPSLVVKKKAKTFSQKFSHHTGFVLSDPSSGKELININGDKYFTPASNTKILTLYAALRNLGDSVPALRYRISGDSLLISGTGDPSFLYQQTFNNNRAFDFLRNFSGSVYLDPGNYAPSPYGPGWAWDDFDADYQAERSTFPVYGNLVSVKRDDQGLKIIPARFSGTTDLEKDPSGFFREQRQNSFYLPVDKITGREVFIPFITADELTAQLLTDTIKKMVRLIRPSNRLQQILYSIPSDSLYKTMMQKSDNLIAEQLLMMVSDHLTDTLDTRQAIRRILATDFADLPQRPVWVDGSGLSRYNQITPMDIVMVWKKILDIRSQERLFPLLAASGRKGTLSSLNQGASSGTSEARSFIFGKTGTLSNNYSLSGYLITRRNRLLIFSSMNANFTVPARKVRDELEHLLNYIHERY